jgi:hypothetical protein
MPQVHFRPCLKLIYWQPKNDSFTAAPRSEKKDKKRKGRAHSPLPSDHANTAELLNLSDVFTSVSNLCQNVEIGAVEKLDMFGLPIRSPSAPPALQSTSESNPFENEDADPMLPSLVDMSLGMSPAFLTVNAEHRCCLAPSSHQPPSSTLSDSRLTASMESKGRVEAPATFTGYPNASSTGPLCQR